MRHIIVLFILATVMVAGGCASPSMAKHQPGMTGGLARGRGVSEQAAAAAQKSPAEPSKTASGASSAEQKPVPTLAVIDARKVVYEGAFTVLVNDVTQAQDATKALAEGLGGYMQKMSAGMIVIRVPAEKFDQAAQGLARIGTVASREITAEDVTERYADIETRLRNQKALKEKILQLLAKSATAKDALALEQEAARVTTKIENLEGLLNRLANQVAYGTLTVNFSSPVKYVAPELSIQLPFPWLRTLGLGTLLQFDGKGIY